MWISVHFNCIQENTLNTDALNAKKLLYTTSIKSNKFSGHAHKKDETQLLLSTLLKRNFFVCYAAADNTKVSDC